MPWLVHKVWQWGEICMVVKFRWGGCLWQVCQRAVFPATSQNLDTGAMSLNMCCLSVWFFLSDCLRVVNSADGGQEAADTLTSFQFYYKKQYFSGLWKYLSTNINSVDGATLTTHHTSVSKLQPSRDVATYWLNWPQGRTILFTLFSTDSLIF